MVAVAVAVAVAEVEVDVAPEVEVETPESQSPNITILYYTPKAFSKSDGRSDQVATLWHGEDTFRDVG